MPTAKHTDSTPPFSQSLGELEAIVTKFRDETVPLEEAMTLFEAGIQHVNTCQTYLDTTRGKIEVLVQGLNATDGGIEPITEPFDEAE